MEHLQLVKNTHSYTHPSIYPSIHLSIYPSIYLFTYLSIHPSIHPSICLFITGTHSVSRSQRETLFISTLTCSTKLTQKGASLAYQSPWQQYYHGYIIYMYYEFVCVVDMLSLLKWRSRSRDLSLILFKLKEVGEEIMKFLQDTLDSLFNILTEYSDPYAEIVISALVICLSVFLSTYLSVCLHI